MTPEDVERFVNYNEASDGPLHRLQLEFESSYAVVLLNELGLPLQSHLHSLIGASLARENILSDGDLSVEWALNTTGLSESLSTKVRSWVVYYDGQRLIIPTVSKKTKAAATLPASVGIVITGKQNMVEGSKITAAHMLSKQTPTPFIVDEWGDSWNDSFNLEPRIVDSVPLTVFNCIEGILSAGKKAFQAGAYDIAASKYQKAFHYCHKYYPENLDDADLQTATQLKMRSLLNLALAGLKSKKEHWIYKCIEACDFILEMPECQASNRAKALYRRGRARILQGDEQLAKEDLELSLAEMDNPETRAALMECEAITKSRNTKLKDKLKNAFS